MSEGEEVSTASVPAGQRPDQRGDPRREWIETASWIGGWAAVLALSLWLSQLSTIWVSIAAAGSALWSLGAIRSRRSGRLVGALLLWVATAIGGTAQYRLSGIVSEWETLYPRIEQSSVDSLNASLDALMDQGDLAVNGAAEAAREVVQGGSLTALFERLGRIQETTGVSAVALFAPGGASIAWAGEHRGTIPIEARQGTQSYVFHEGPLFTYLYFVRTLDTGQTAMAAFLLESSVETRTGELSFGEQFEQRKGVSPRFCSPDQACAQSVWDWAATRGPVVMSVSFDGLTQQNWWRRQAESGRGLVGMIGLVALIVLGLAWYRARHVPAAVPVAVATASLIIAPVGLIVRSASPLYSPVRFAIPGPLDITLWILLVFLGGVSLWVLMRFRGAASRRIPLWAVVPLIAGVFPAALEIVHRSVSSALLRQHAAGGFPLQLVTALLMAVPIFLLMRVTRPIGMSRGKAVVVAALGYLLPALFGVVILFAWHPERNFFLGMSAVWVLPAALLVVAHSDLPSLRSSLRLWLAAGWLAGTASLSFLWPLHVRAQLTNAEREVSQLGIRQDGYLEIQLRTFADRAADLAGRGESGVNLLYHSWAGSGLTREGYEARIGLWRNGQLERELNLSATGELSPEVMREISLPRESPYIRHFGGAEGLHYLLVVPIPDSSTISVVIPPHRRIRAATPLARLLHADQGAQETTGENLYLVPIDSGGLARGHLTSVKADTIHWIRENRSWRSETLVQMPEGMVHAHLDVATSGIALLIARAALLQVGILLVLLLFWAAARLMCRELSLVPFLKPEWLGSFRGRLSVSLFIFFLLPTVVFGAASYTAVAREVVRSSAALAHQALDEAAARLPGATMAQLAESAGSDLLLYRQGTLAPPTAPEVLELGLFHTWLTPTVYLRLASGLVLQELERRDAQSEYLVAYRRLDGGSVLAAPIPLDAEEITRRQQEFRDIALLVVLLGLGLSIVLALLVSRALARPLDELSHAALTVGAGNLQTRLPETRSDEFGSVYASFNRMIGRLRSTRAALEQETRRTETIVAEAATGVLALDADGAVELINPRAAEILGMPLEAGTLLTTGDSADRSLSAAVAELWRSGAPEAGTELNVDGRIVRLRLRRLSAADGGGGAVVAVEDLTAEVQTARVLAWGEMARQVAHEIKNPLTPIKLAVQHVRRAFFDKRPDFGEILERNVDAILREIDRLGEISRAFSRFGTPATESVELEKVDVRRAIEDTLALYGSGDGGLVFRTVIQPERLPPVIARAAELKEVLVNLLENAREAVGGAGEIVVSAFEEGRDPGNRSPSPPSGRVSVVVSDTGMGIPEDQLAKIFEPHFSTRSSGTGLGLAIVRRIADSWGAEIRVDSKVGTGTRIELLLREANGADSRVGM